MLWAFNDESVSFEAQIKTKSSKEAIISTLLVLQNCSVSSSMSDGSPIYLDYNATTPLLPEVKTSIIDVVNHTFGNPSSSYSSGKAASDVVKKARREVAVTIGASKPDDEITFTSGGTEVRNK